MNLKLNKVLEFSLLDLLVSHIAQSLKYYKTTFYKQIFKPRVCILNFKLEKMRICKRKFSVLCHNFPCPSMWEVLYIYFSILKNKLSYLHITYQLTLCFTSICPSTAHSRFSLEDISQSVFLDISGFFEHQLVLESFVTCSLHFFSTLLWLFSLSSFLPVLLLLVLLKALPGLFLLPVHVLPG